MRTLKRLCCEANEVVFKCYTSIAKECSTLLPILAIAKSPIGKNVLQTNVEYNVFCYHVAFNETYIPTCRLMPSLFNRWCEYEWLRKLLLNESCTTVIVPCCARMSNPCQSLMTLQPLFVKYRCRISVRRASECA